MAAARFFVEGHVQGVFFRASAREQARHLGVRGYARNLHDGRVEVLAVGDVQAVERLGEWLKHGPSRARVDRIERIAADDDEAGPEFETA
ncbi:MAG TPA: acylphosphatase [Lysobacter sp.]|nr:acylphosphatase [Lysobacter sp.]